MNNKTDKEYRGAEQCYSYSELRAITGKECGEPLLDIKTVAPELLCGSQNENMTPYVGDAMLLRKGCIDLLSRAQSSLDKRLPGAKLKVLYAYRHPEVQERYYAKYFARVAEENPGKSNDELRELTHYFIAEPEVAGHPTGGAIDITIVHEGVPLDMGGKPGDFTKIETFPVWSPAISDVHLAHRLLLRDILVAEGFAPYDFEWWHFSYGDREWACYYKKNETIYGEIRLSLKA